MPEQEQSQEAQQEQKPAASAAEPSKTDTQQQEQTVPYSRFKEINDRLKMLEEQREQEAKAREEEENKKLADQQRWQELYETSTKKLAELTPKADLADKLAEKLLDQYEKEIANWPDEVKGMAPKPEASILDKLDWLDRARPLAKALSEGKTPPAGNGPRPRSTAPAGQHQNEQRTRASYERWARSQF